ncbi:MAG: hypothetical protein F4X72_00800 [Dehalococcoidia bacterium]|nr:hypothetical protein [Dehalococcoidia bacterium]
MTDRTHFIIFMTAVVAHVALVFATRVILDGSEDAMWRFPVALAPMSTALLLLLLGVSQFRRWADELDRRIMLEALVISFWGTLVVTSAYGSLQRAGLPDLNWLWVSTLMVVLWSIGLAVAKRRYR